MKKSEGLLSGRYLELVKSPVLLYKKYTLKHSYDMDDEGLEEDWDGNMDQYDNLYNNSR